MHVGNARLNTRRLSARAPVIRAVLRFSFFLFGSKALQNAVAEGDTRTISMHHLHTDEDITITYKRDGRYDEAALEKLNWFLRDWRRERTDPHGPAPDRPGVGGAARGQYRASRSRSSAATVRRKPTPCCATAASGVARFSQHMLGHAMDFYIPGIPLETAARDRAAAAARRRRLLSRPPARPSCTWTPAASACGRA